jgi:hypothetical protein
VHSDETFEIVTIVMLVLCFEIGCACRSGMEARSRLRPVLAC